MDLAKLSVPASIPIQPLGLRGFRKSSWNTFVTAAKKKDVDNRASSETDAVSAGQNAISVFDSKASSNGPVSYYAVASHPSQQFYMANAYTAQEGSNLYQVLYPQQHAFMQPQYLGHGVPFQSNNTGKLAPSRRMTPESLNLQEPQANTVRRRSRGLLSLFERRRKGSNDSIPSSAMRLGHRSGPQKVREINP